MKTLLVPHAVDQTSARVWVGVSETDAPPAGASLSLLPENRQIPLTADAWQSVSAGGELGVLDSRSFVQRVTLESLRADTKYVATLSEAVARFSTLPSRLPGREERPFSVLLSSCFHRNTTGNLAAALRRIDEHLRPQLKILCGDQVYLDYPAFILGLPFATGRLAAELLQKYRHTWEEQSGYRALLEQAGTYFLADDHEFWNNYPNWTTLISNTWTKSGRDDLKRIALSLFTDFQSDDPRQVGRPRQFTVGRLSFFIADTRVFRQPGDREFMDPPDLQRLLAWIGQLEGPGVLVVGQPLFQGPANWFTKRFADRALANYEQYKDLVRAIFSTQHSLLVLTGDVHFARVASCRLAGGSGAELVEVIASPCSLVNPLVGRKAKTAPDKFPPDSISGVPRVAVTTHYTAAEDHVATLHFTETSGVVNVEVRYWLVDKEGSASAAVASRHALN